LGFAVLANFGVLVLPANEDARLLALIAFSKEFVFQKPGYAWNSNEFGD